MLRRQTIVARRLRRDATEAEKKLWQAFRDLPLPVRFRRQHPIAGYVADFASPQAKLVVELDGGQHAVQPETDEVRSAALAQHGYRVLRFWNGDVMESPSGVLQAIASEVALLCPPHPPHRLSGGSPPLRAERADDGKP
jgi:very-short-patch-repair endonuclease